LFPIKQPVLPPLSHTVTDPTNTGQVRNRQWNISTAGYRYRARHGVQR